MLTKTEQLERNATCSKSLKAIWKKTLPYKENKIMKTLEKLFMRVILPVVILGATCALIALTVCILPNNFIGFALSLVSGAAIGFAGARVYRMLYRAWLSTKQDEIKARIIERARAKGGEEGANIMLKVIEDNGILIDY